MVIVLMTLNCRLKHIVTTGTHSNKNRGQKTSFIAMHITRLRSSLQITNFRLFWLLLRNPAIFIMVQRGSLYVLVLFKCAQYAKCLCRKKTIHGYGTGDQQNPRSSYTAVDFIPSLCLIVLVLSHIACFVVDRTSILNVIFPLN